ncbi:MAG: methyl-accepting chemotaxis protein [Lachnospiraceae bacterium]|nr:methyl-accepting chemotaxis protein [Lachnospiraceae bacterium]
MKSRKRTKEEFVGIEKKIAYSFAAVVICCNLLLGTIVSYLSYTSSISAVEETIDETSVVAGDLITASIREYTAIAYETGSIARLADPERSVEDKKAIIQQRVEDHNFEDGILLDQNGKNVFTGEDLSDKEYFQACMKGETYIGTPAYSEILGAVVMTVAAPLWQDGIPHTTPVGAVVYVPDGEFINDIIRGIQVGSQGTAFMVDANGTTIGDVNSSLVGVENGIQEGKEDRKLAKFGKIVEKMAKGENGTGSFKYNGKTKIVAYAPVPESDGWSVGVVAVRNQFLGKFYLSLIITVIIVVGCTIIGVRVGFKKGKEIATPITRAVERLKLLATGDLHTEVERVKTQDETEILTENLYQTIRRLKEIIEDISKNLEELSNGNFTLQLQQNYVGDFSEITDSFRAIVSSLNAAMKEIDNNAEHVSLGADDLSKASQALAEGATDQASAIEELTATVTDISEKISENAENANTAKNIVEQMNQEIQNSNGHMTETAQAMDHIKEASNEIANIIMSIEDIASQTNLLSLNAAIEAARAGEAGKGFSVVADQVRQLAEQSASAAKDTTALIENAIKAVEDGKKLTDITAESMNTVVEQAGEVQISVANIAAASNVQAEAASQITEGINQIATVIETNSATAEESAASSEELSSQSTELKALLEKFQF